MTDKINNQLQRFYSKLSDDLQTPSDLLDIARKLEYLIKLKMKEEAIQILNMLK